MISGSHLEIVVTDGWVTLDGDVEEEYQKEDAETTVSKVIGVRGITNNIAVKQKVRPADITLHIERVFQRSAMRHAQDIHVVINHGKVILSGIVRAWIEKADAEEAAREVPGVTEVENRLEITPFLKGKENHPALV